MTKTLKKRRLQGKVVSDKMDKTIVVLVEKIKTHPKYHKQYTVSKRYKAHDQKNEYHTGEQVIIEAARPLSREKKWRVMGKINVKSE